MSRLRNAKRSLNRDAAGQCIADRGKPPQVGAVLRRARMHRQLSLRDVERRTGRSNAYLSQIERGLIKRPDPVVLLELAELYALNFELLAAWAGWANSKEQAEENSVRGDSTTALVRKVLELDDKQRSKALSLIERLLRESRT